MNYAMHVQLNDSMGFAHSEHSEYSLQKALKKIRGSRKCSEKGML